MMMLLRRKAYEKRKDVFSPSPSHKYIIFRNSEKIEMNYGWYLCMYTI
tara:strand:+ start:828 stop:971 length:144 start_codon:yes stop_codon:yes gene_type:complete